MKIGFWAMAGILFLAVASIYYVGCKKSNSPLGVYAPDGADVPTATFTPVFGSFNIYVIDNQTAVQGVSCFLIDPDGNSYNANTQSGAPSPAAFQINNVINGTWTAGVYAQNISNSFECGLSTQAVTINNHSGTNVTFSAGGQSVSMWNVTNPEKYNYGGGTLTYGVTYIQPSISGQSILNEPVSLYLDPSSTGLPISWVSFSNTTVGSKGANSATVTLMVPCSVSNIHFAVDGSKFFGVGQPFVGNFHDVSRNFIVTASLIWSSTTTYPYFDCNYCTETSGPLQLSSTNDCGTTWGIWVGSTYQGTFTNGQSLNISEEGTASCNAVAVSFYSPMVGGGANGSGCSGTLASGSF